MPLVLNEEQRLLRDTSREFLQRSAPVAALRALRDERNSLGYQADLWAEMAEMGWACVTLPEAYGGLDFGFLGLGCVLEETGRTLTASPLFASAVLGSNTILLAGTESQKEHYLPRIATGELTVALALDESHHHAPADTGCTAQCNDEHAVISGRKVFVADGHSAELLLVVAEDQYGLGIYAIPENTPGLLRERTVMVDSRNAANLTLNAVTVPLSQRLGGTEDCAAALEQALDRGRLALSAEMLGLVEEVFERTVAYLKEREQFGALIGSFQALQHRAAQLQAEIELCRSVVMQGLSAIDDAPEQVPLTASLAKARLNDLAEWATNEAVQMHGGIGVTDELEIGFFLKRARVSMQMLGDTAFHRDRYATLSGY
ncbi:MAG: acyl-CoA dehydrogenase family protein [Halieaceae bacterium]|nr:acyl-CoA dehydrogenase family protein [Halieaceae bacterium]